MEKRSLRTRGVKSTWALLASLILLVSAPTRAQTPLLDSTFVPIVSGGNTQVYAVAVQPDGKVLIGGDFDCVNGVSQSNLARLTPNGELDAGFDPGSGPNGDVRALRLLATGQVLIGGNFDRVDGVQREHVARLNADGSLDAAFDPGSGPDGDVEALAVQPQDGKVVIGGEFTSVAAVSRPHIARLLDTGVLDAGFNPGTGTDGEVRTLALQGDGRILVGGDFTNFNGTVRNGLVRLTVGGAADPGFNTGSGANRPVRTLAVQPDGKILVGGEFTSFNGASYRRLLRLETNGNFDVTFQPRAGAEDDVRSIAVQSDGKIVIGGTFTNFDGVACIRLGRLSPDGRPDATFTPVVSETVRQVVNTPADQVYVAGDFTAVNGQSRCTAARFVTRTPWGRAQTVGVWKYLDWFGYFGDEFYPWVYHLQHGWMFGAGEDEDSVWLFTASLGFLWTGQGVAPWFYRLDAAAWLYYLRDSASPRWFYNATAGRWEAY